jgi:hypothetical protein
MATPPPLPPVTTLEEIHAALGAIDVERLAVQDIINNEANEEARLIDEDATDQELYRARMRVRGARRDLVRLERREFKILSAAAAIDDAKRQEQWTDFRERYSRAALRLHNAVAECIDSRAALEAIVTASQRAGLGAPSAPAFPTTLVTAQLSWGLLLMPFDESKRLPETPPAAYRSSGLPNLGPIEQVEIVREFGGLKPRHVPWVPFQRARWLIEQGIAKPYVYNPWGEMPEENLSGVKEK